MSTTTSPNYSDTTSRAVFVPNALDYVALLLVIIGGINWGLVGAFGIDLVERLFGDMTMPTRVIYGLVGLAALYALSFLARFPRSQS